MDNGSTKSATKAVTPRAQSLISESSNLETPCLKSGMEIAMSTKTLAPMSATVATDVVRTALDRYRAIDQSAELLRDADAHYLNAMSALVCEHGVMVQNGWSAGRAWEVIAETIVKRAMSLKTTRVYADRIKADFSANSVRQYAASAEWAIDNGLDATARIVTPREAKALRGAADEIVKSYDSPQGREALGLSADETITIAKVVDAACTGKGAVSPIALANAVKDKPATSTTTTTTPAPSGTGRVDVMTVAQAIARATEMTAALMALEPIINSGTHDADAIKVLTRDGQLLKALGARLVTKYGPKPEPKPQPAAA